MRILGLFLILTSLAAFLAPSAADVPDTRPGAAAATNGTAAIALLDRLSRDLRGKRLTIDEKDRLQQDVASQGLRAVYLSLLDQWLDRRAYRRLLFPQSYDPPEVEAFFHRLETYRHGGMTIHHLPRAGAHRDGQPPCTPDQVVMVKPWWTGESIAVCADSYRPERVFDEVGYCAGHPEPTDRQPPRPGCGCGPRLLGCIPPHGFHSIFDGQGNRDVEAEVVETSLDIITRNEPYASTLTTSRTWQSGLVEFLYLRRELIQLMREVPYSTALEKKIDERLRKIDIHAPARWIERQGIYRGTGLWATPPAVHAARATYRDIAFNALIEYLCVRFHSIHVDSEALLAAVGNEFADLQEYGGLGGSPMRKQPGCKGCHNPIDGSGAMLQGLAMPLYGSYVTGADSRGSLYVTGDSDVRGHGASIADMARLIVQQPEYATCTVHNSFQRVLKQDVLASDRPFLDQLVAEFRANGGRLAPIIRALLTSKTYTGLDL